MIKEVQEKTNNNLFDWLLVLGLVLAPMTSLRFWKIGPAESLVFIWCLRQVKRQFELNDISWFYIIFLACQILGTIWCLIISPSEVALALYSSWFYLGFVSIYMYVGLKKYDLAYVKKLFSLFANISVFWYAFLFLYARFIGSKFLGAQLWYGTQRFSGGATNPHQISILFCGLLMYFLREVFYKERVVFNIFKIFICFYIVLQTKSSTGVMAIFLGVFAGVLLFTSKLSTSKIKRAIIMFSEILIITLLVIVLFNKFYYYIYYWIASDSNGLGRFYLFSQTKDVFLKSPIVGLGPGWHVISLKGEPIEIHNTFLEVLASAGILGLFELLVFTYKQVIKIVRVDTLYLPIIVSIYAYGLSGFSLRKLVYWGLTVFVLIIVEKEHDNNSVGLHV